MSGRRSGFVGGAFGCLLALVGAAPTLGQSRSQEAVADLLREHPEATVLWDEGGEGTRARMLFGAPMTRAESAREAAEMFLFLYGEAFIDGDVELEESRVFPMKDGRRTVFAYRQAIEDVPVDGSIVRVMVSDDGESDPVVVYAAGHFARPPAGGLPEPLVTAGDALEAAMEHPAAEFLERWGDPELVVTTESGALSRGGSLLLGRWWGGRRQAQRRHRTPSGSTP